VSEPKAIPSCLFIVRKNGTIGVLDRVISTAYPGTLGKDTLFTTALEIFLPHPVKPPCVELFAAKPAFSQKHFPKTDVRKNTMSQGKATYPVPMRKDI